MVKCNPCLGARRKLINLTLVTQEDPDAWRKREEKMKREIADLTRWKMKAKSKAAKDKEDQVHSELLARDATRASVKSSDLVSKLNSMYGPQDHLNKPSVSVTKPSIKGASPAKRSRDEETRPVTAGSPHTKSGHRHQGLPEMPPWQGPHPIKMTPKKPLGQGSYLIPKNPSGRDLDRLKELKNPIPEPQNRQQNPTLQLTPFPP